MLYIWLCTSVGMLGALPLVCRRETARPTSADSATSGRCCCCAAPAVMLLLLLLCLPAAAVLMCVCGSGVWYDQVAVLRMMELAWRKRERDVLCCFWRWGFRLVHRRSTS